MAAYFSRPNNTKYLVPFQTPIIPSTLSNLIVEPLITVTSAQQPPADLPPVEKVPAKNMVKLS